MNSALSISRTITIQQEFTSPVIGLNSTRVVAEERSSILSLTHFIEQFHGHPQRLGLVLFGVTMVPFWVGENRSEPGATQFWTAFSSFKMGSKNQFWITPNRVMTRFWMTRKQIKL